MRIKGLLTLFIAFLFLVNTNCGGGGSSGGGTTKVTVITKLKKQNAKSDSIKIMSISQVRLTVTGPDMKPIISTQTVTADQQYVEFNLLVPNGKDRLFTVEMFDENGNLKYRGEKLVDLNGEPITIEIELERIAACNDIVKEGYDEPETIVVELGQSSGTFQFEYETYSIKDRITITYEGRVIYDSGCVGTNGIVTEFISYSGNSTNVVINVEPNCEGTIGTAWYFVVYCPNTFISSPIVGTWTYGELQKKNGDWISKSGRITFNQDGTGVDKYVIHKKDMIENMIENFKYTTKNNGDGSYDISIIYPDNRNVRNRFIISDSNSIMLMDGTNIEDVNTIRIHVKTDSSSSYSNATVIGDYYLMGYEYNPLGNILWLQKYKIYKKHYLRVKMLSLQSDIYSAAWSGIRTFDGEGTSTALITVNVGDAIITNGYADSYSINSDGFASIRGDELKGYLTDNKFGIFSIPTDLNDWLILFLMMKGDKEYSNSDLEGIWALSGFGDSYEQSNGTKIFNSTTGTLTCDIDANCILSLNKLENNSISYIESSFIFNVDNDGSFGTYNGTISPIYASVIGYNGNIIFLNLSFGQNGIFNKEILLGVKCNKCANIIGMAEKKMHLLKRNK